MILRYIHTLWRIFWRILFLFAATILVLLLVTVGLLQLPKSQGFIKNEVVTAFNRQYEGELSVGEVSGFLPFSATVSDMEFSHPDFPGEPAILISRAEVNISLWYLLQRSFVVSSFEIQSPVVNLKRADDRSNVTALFTRLEERERDSASPTPGQEPASSPQLFTDVSIYAPSLTIASGTLTADHTVQIPENLALPTPLLIDDIHLEIFLEATERQIFFDLTSLTADIPNSTYGNLSLSGQFYNDGEFFELNRFQISTETAHADFSFEARPVDLREPDLGEQFQDARYSIDISESSFHSEFIRQFIPAYPTFPEDLQITLISEGDADEYFVDRFEAGIGESSILISAQGRNLFQDSMSFQTILDNVVIHPDQLSWISDTYLEGETDLTAYQLSVIRGELGGTPENLSANFLAETLAGSFRLQADLTTGETPRYNLLFEVDELHLTPFVGDSLRPNILQGSITLEGENFGEDARFNSELDLSASTVFGHDVETFQAIFNYDRQRLQYDITGTDSELFVSARGSYSDQNGHKHFISDGRVEQFDLTTFLPEFHADSTQFHSTFSANLEWNSMEDVTGRVSFDIERSLINADTLRPHQFYADINGSGTERQLRFTSSFFDGEITGDLAPAALLSANNYWTDYLKERVYEELLFRTDSLDGLTGAAFPGSHPLNLNMEVAVKDLSLLRKYLPELPEIQSNARFTANLNATPERFTITGTLYDPLFLYGNYSAESLNTDFTASFRHGVRLKDSSTLDIQLHTARTELNNIVLREERLTASMRDSLIQLSQYAMRMDDDLTLELDAEVTLGQEQISAVLARLVAGSSEYQWESEGEPHFIYTADRKLHVRDFAVSSGDDHLFIAGTYSTDPEDVVSYNIQNLDLGRISDLISGRVTFSGVANGNFQTRSLTHIPVFQGNLRVDEGRMMDRLIGDVTLRSVLNPDENRFDTEIRVFTNPEKYPRYLQENDDIGQDLLLTGYFRMPGEEIGPDEQLFYFDADLREIDLWIVTVIVPNVITDMEGMATGQGYIHGSRSDFDFHSTFTVEEAVGVPVFTGVPYTLNGDLTFNKSEGLIFHDVQLRDAGNGTGTLSGIVDLNNFEPTTYINLGLNLNNLHFMSNPYDPDIPFYGDIYGTGRAEISGTNFSPALRTVGTLQLASSSRVSIPLEPETDFEQGSRFIQFTDSFDDPFGHSLQTDLAGNGESDESRELTFMERFTMDLQFQAADPINVRLIFDPVTNDILSANGTGNMRILLEDQNVSMFGQFSIVGGEYQFVSGDIFTRRFNLESGGTISWSGDLIDANLDVTAVYRARPNISTLMSSGTGAGATAGLDPGQRIPVELVLEIGGTITSVENEFFFRMPTGIDAISDPTIAAQINNLNQNEDEKLIQATSILLSGNFLPTSQAQGLSFADSFTGASVVSPFVTSQIINPLLSNQINSLLRSDIAFDIDFNLTTMNEVDLGVALRLFDDRIILRREGQITGEQSDIGDLGATYRINRTFSVTAFHRQDPTLSYTSGVNTRQSQEMNGIGLEAQVQFNTWKHLRERVSDAVRRLFGIEPKTTSLSGDEQPEDEISG